jgi:hypothetical protein
MKQGVGFGSGVALSAAMAKSQSQSNGDAHIASYSNFCALSSHAISNSIIFAAFDTV